MFVIVFQTFVDLHRAFSLKRQTVVTCISTLKKSHDEEKAVSCLILGTESSMIYILDPEAFTILDTLIVPAPPSHLGRSESTPSFEITTYIFFCVKEARFSYFQIILSYPLAGLFEYLFMFWLHRHLPVKQVLNSKHSHKGMKENLATLIICNLDIFFRHEMKKNI